MSQLLNKIPQLEKERPSSQDAPEAFLNKQESLESGVEKQPELKESKEFNESELERLRQEVLEEVDVDELPSKKPAPSPVQTVSRATVNKPQTLLMVESVMEEGLDDIFLKMDLPLQNKFKEEGEKTARAINEILESGKIEGRKIFKLILKWLKIIPGVNKFFLKQEAKIKTDKVINIRQ